jgi:hypothetical protein
MSAIAMEIDRMRQQTVTLNIDDLVKVVYSVHNATEGHPPHAGKFSLYLFIFFYHF